ncbi:MAG: hypothetical protein AAGB06_06260 [Verrucomicrobiota bacterium]
MLEIDSVFALFGVVVKGALSLLSGFVGVLILSGVGSLFVRQGPEKSFRVEMELENHQGFRVQATVLGRTENEILLIRDGDGLEFTYSIMDLSKKSMKLLKEYPANNHPVLPKPVELPPYVRSKLERVVELRQKVEGVRHEMGEYLVNQNRLKLKGLLNEIQRIDLEIQDSNQKIFKFCKANNIDKRDVLEAQMRLISKSWSLFSQNDIGG